MTPGRFSLIVLLLVAVVTSAICYKGMPWRGVAFPLVGLLLCLLMSGKRILEFVSAIPRIGTEVLHGKITSTPSSDGYFWAGRSLSFKEACHHFIVVGATGCGKSITLNLLMQSVFSKFGRPDADGRIPKRRAVVYDSKMDLVSVLAGMSGGIDRIRILNPLDERFTPWDISADIRSETDAYDFAALLIEKNERDGSPYFSDTARSLVAGVIKRFQFEAEKAAQATPNREQKPNAWTLRDVILAFESTETLRNVLDHPETYYLLDHFSQDNAKNFAGVKSTVDTALAIYRPIAALLASSPNEPISLKHWAENHESILVLGNHEMAREATDTLNRLIIQHLSKVLISREGLVDTEIDQTWIFLDELREAGALKGLRQLLLRGRSKGVAVAMGFQDVEGILAVYGDHEGAEIMGAAQNAIILHVNPTAPKTTQWASDVCSSRRDIMPSTSTTHGDRLSVGAQQSSQLVPNVYPIQFVELPLPSREEGLKCYSFTNRDGYRYLELPWKEFIEKEGYFDLADPIKHPDFRLQRKRHCYRLRAWQKGPGGDYARLELSEKAPLRTLRQEPDDRDALRFLAVNSKLK